MSSPTDPVVTPADVRRRIAGTDNWLTAALHSAAAYDDAAITEAIEAATRTWERETQFLVRPRRIVMDDDGTYSGAGSLTSPDQQVLPVEPLPYYQAEAIEYVTATLPYRPVQRVLRMRIILGRGHTLMTIPNDWVQWDRRNGSVWLQPVTGSVASSGIATSFGLLEMNFGDRGYLPHALCYDYDAGLPDGWQADPQWADLKRALAARAAILVLTDIAETFDAGKGAKTVGSGGFSQSVSYDRFERAIAKLQAEVDRVAALVRAQEAPLLLTRV